MSELPQRAGDAPIKVELEAGKTYAYCTCGLSASQPFCDGKHAGTGMGPKVFKSEETTTAFLCSCKSSANAPFCDGSHKG